MLKTAVVKNKPVLAVKYLMKAKEWITDIITQVDDIVKRYDKHNESVKTCTSDVFQEQAKTKEKIEKKSDEMKGLKDALAKLEVDLEIVVKKTKMTENQIKNNTEELNSFIRRFQEEHGHWTKKFLDAFRGYPDAMKESTAIDLDRKLKQLDSEKSLLKNEEWNIKTKQLDLQLQLANCKIRMGEIPDPDNLTEVQKHLNQIQQILIDLQKFWEKVDAILKTLRDRTFAGEEMVDMEDMKDEFISSIEDAAKNARRNSAPLLSGPERNASNRGASKEQACGDGQVSRIGNGNRNGLRQGHRLGNGLDTGIAVQHLGPRIGAPTRIGTQSEWPPKRIGQGHRSGNDLGQSGTASANGLMNGPQERHWTRTPPRKRPSGHEPRVRLGRRPRLDLDRHRLRERPRLGLGIGRRSGTASHRAPPSDRRSHGHAVGNWPFGNASWHASAPPRQSGQPPQPPAIGIGQPSPGTRLCSPASANRLGIGHASGTRLGIRALPRERPRIGHRLRETASGTASGTGIGHRLDRAICTGPPSATASALPGIGTASARAPPRQYGTPRHAWQGTASGTACIGHRSQSRDAPASATASGTASARALHRNARDAEGPGSSGWPQWISPFSLWQNARRNSAPLLSGPERNASNRGASKEQACGDGQVSRIGNGNRNGLRQGHRLGNGLDTGIAVQHLGPRIGAPTRIGTQSEWPPKRIGQGHRSGNDLGQSGTASANGLMNGPQERHWTRTPPRKRPSGHEPRVRLGRRPRLDLDRHRLRERPRLGLGIGRRSGTASHRAPPSDRRSHGHAVGNWPFGNASWHASAPPRQSGQPPQPPAIGIGQPSPGTRLCSPASANRLGIGHASGTRLGIRALPRERPRIGHRLRETASGTASGTGIGHRLDRAICTGPPSATASALPGIGTASARAPPRQYGTPRHAWQGTASGTACIGHRSQSRDAPASATASGTASARALHRNA
ncbi:hypothetical protein cypCar_00039823, partial [Cyprinus carpio]